MALGQVLTTCDRCGPRSNRPVRWRTDGNPRRVSRFEKTIARHEGDLMVHARLVQTVVAVQHHHGRFEGNSAIARWSLPQLAHDHSCSFTSPSGGNEGDIQGHLGVEQFRCAQLLSDQQGNVHHGASVVTISMSRTSNAAKPGSNTHASKNGSRSTPVCCFQCFLEVLRGDRRVRIVLLDASQGLTEQFVAEIATKVVHHASTFVVGMRAVDVRIGHRRERLEATIVQVRRPQARRGGCPSRPCRTQVLAANHSSIRWPLYSAGPSFNHMSLCTYGVTTITPPAVAQLVRQQSTVVEQALGGHELWIRDVGGDLQGAIRGQHITNADRMRKARTSIRRHLSLHPSRQTDRPCRTGLRTSRSAVPGYRRSRRCARIHGPRTQQPPLRSRVWGSPAPRCTTGPRCLLPRRTSPINSPWPRKRKVLAVFTCVVYDARSTKESKQGYHTLPKLGGIVLMPMPRLYM